MKRLICIVMLVGVVWGEQAGPFNPKLIKPSKDVIKQQRVDEIEAMLIDGRTEFGRPIGDRAAWEKLAKREDFQEIIKKAEKLMAEPIPEQPAELYMEYFKTGNRSRFQRVAWRRRGRVRTFMLAECLENKGRFIPALEEIIEALCAEPTWIFPAHDRDAEEYGTRKLENFRGESINIDLVSSALGWSMATADYLLGEKLSDKTRKLIRKNLRHHLFEPFRKTATGQDKRTYWLGLMNNWNSVCLANVTGAAMAIIEDKDERAFFATAAEVYSQNFANGSGSDGYCGEGVGYWNYGFGHYLILAEILWQSTDGKLDILDREHIPAIAKYGAHSEIINRTYPTFADCSLKAKPRARIMNYASRKLGLGWSDWENTEMVGVDSRGRFNLMYSFENSASVIPPAKKGVGGPGLRSFFPEAGVLVCRGEKGTKSSFGIAAKGGHNEEYHNNNDVGSFIVVVDDRALLVDPGKEVYTRRTFSPGRYESNVLNSFGHSVPMVAGKLQRNGQDAKGEIVRTEFTDAKDTFVIDMRTAYDVEELEKIQRTFEFSRDGAGSFTVTDEVKFTEPKSFGTALITFDKWKKVGEKSLLVYDSQKAVRVDIEVEGGEFEITSQEIKENMPNKVLPIRLGINMTEPVTKAVIKLKITPAQGNIK